MAKFCGDNSCGYFFNSCLDPECPEAPYSWDLDVGENTEDESEFFEDNLPHDEDVTPIPLLSGKQRKRDYELGLRKEVIFNPHPEKRRRQK